MSEFRVDLRLPIAALRRAPFLYVGPDFRSLPLGVFSDIVEHRGRQMQRLYPFTVSEAGDDGSEDLLFSLAFFYINDDDERVVFLTHPVPLGGAEAPGALEALLGEAERLAAFLDGHLIEVEVHDGMRGHVAFPASLSFHSYDLASAAFTRLEADLLEKHRFREAAEVVCLEQSASELETGAGLGGEKTGRYIVSSVSPREYTAVREKAEEFPVRSYELTRRDDAFKPTRLPFFEETAYAARRRPRWRMRRGRTEGYLRWSPDIMEIQTPFPLLFYPVLEGRGYRYGKIFDWGLRGEDRDLLAALLSRAVTDMARRGIEGLQFAHVDGGQRFVRGFLEELGFEVAHRIRLLRKEVG